MIPMVDLAPQLAATEPAWRANLDRMFASKQFIGGQQLESFEREFAQAMGSGFAVGVGSGTSAIELCLRAAGLGGSGREVILPALTSLFTAQAVIAAGCIPRFADVDPESLLLSQSEAAGLITRKTGAILAVHLYGRPCDLTSLSALAREARIALVQDACQAHGARWNDLPLTAYSPFVAYSFYPTKNLGALGDGGAVATNRQSVQQKILLLRDGGRRGDQISRIHASNSRLDEIQCCYLRAFLPNLAAWNARRAALTAIYDAAFAGEPQIRPVPHGRGSAHHLYVIRVARRDLLRAHLERRGIASSVHYPVPLHLQPAFRRKSGGRATCPVAEKACSEILSLPLTPFLTEEAAQVIAQITIEWAHDKQAQQTPFAPAPSFHLADSSPKDVYPI